MNLRTHLSIYRESPIRCRCKLCGSWFKQDLVLVDMEKPYERYCPACHEPGNIVEEYEVRK